MARDTIPGTTVTGAAVITDGMAAPMAATAAAVGIARMSAPAVMVAVRVAVSAGAVAPPLCIAVSVTRAAVGVVDTLVVDMPAAAGIIARAE